MTYTEENNNYCEERFKKLTDLGNILIQMKTAPPAYVKPNPRGSGAGGAVAQYDPQHKQLMRIQPMPCPRWDRRLRSYAKFKKLWDENITPHYEDSALHVMLCESLPKEVLAKVSTLSSSTEIWSFLDKKYAQPDLVAHETRSELYDLHEKKLGMEFMSVFDVLLNDTLKLLQRTGTEDWLTSDRGSQTWNGSCQEKKN